MEESFKGAVSFALSALHKSMLVLTRRQKEALKSVISCKDTFVSLLPTEHGNCCDYYGGMFDTTFCVGSVLFSHITAL